MLDHTGVVGWPLTTMSWEPRVLELVFLPRLVPHLYPGVHPRRAKARRAKRGDSPYARMSPCARKSSLSQLVFHYLAQTFTLFDNWQGSRRRRLDCRTGQTMYCVSAMSSCSVSGRVFRIRDNLLMFPAL